MLFAKVNKDHRWSATTACGGITFTKSGYLQVPAHEEASARLLAKSKPPVLDVTEDAKAVAKFNEQAAPAPVAAKKSGGGSGGVEISAAAEKAMKDAGLTLADVPGRNQKGNVGKPEVAEAIAAKEAANS